MGQPVALSALPVKEQEKARTLLQDRLAALRRLARDLPGTGSEAALGAALQQALAYPGDETVYVVDGQHRAIGLSEFRLVETEVGERLSSREGSPR